MSRGRAGLALILLLLLVGCGLGGRGCRGADPPPPTVTIPAPPATASPTVTQEVSSTVVLTATRDIPPATATATSTRQIPTATRPFSTPVPALTATPELIGAHRVVAGETMWGIGLVWYAGRFFAWGEDVWRPICEANPEVANCRVIYPGDVLRIPRLH